MKRLRIFITAGLTVLFLAGEAAALPQAVARKCLKMTLEAIPRAKDWRPYRAGNTAAALARQAYYRDCVAKEEKK
jgi:hypothetical protein